uniref:Importin 13a n=1 Tax=Lates calcarifer TaxID=8187 RepID=A0A4W6BQ81_LATCA
METSHGICRIAVAMGETHSRVLLEQVDHWQEYLALVNMILYCTGIPGHYPVSETTSSLTLTFWYTLQDDILSFEEEKQAVYLQVYRPVYFQLVDTVSSSSLDLTSHLLFLKDTEALLFGFQSIAETIDVNYSDVIPGLIGLIPRINISNVMLADTVMYTIGSLAEWLADHPVMLGGILPMVLQGLVKAELSVSSVSTLKRICRECRHDLAPYAQDILTVSQDVLLKEIHKSSQCMWLMQALGFLLSGLPVDEILGRLHSLITPHVQRLDTLAQHELNPTNKQSIVHILGMMSSLFTTLDINVQADSSEGAASPRLTPSQTTQNPVSSGPSSITQNPHKNCMPWNTGTVAVCGVFDKSVRTLLHDFGPMVAQLSEMLGQIYSAFPQASALDLARQMVHIFAGDEHHISDIRGLIEVLTSATLTIFQQGPRDHPDIAESFMHLHAQILKRKPDMYLSDQLDIKALFYCGILSLKFPETPTVKAASLFFTELLPRCKDMPSLGEVLQGDGKLLTETILQVNQALDRQHNMMAAVGGGSPRSLTEYFSEVLLSLNRHCPALLSQWLRETLQTPGFPSAQVSTEQKHTFSQQLLREQTNKRRVKEIVKEFSLLCRGLQGSGYSDY